MDEHQRALAFGHIATKLLAVLFVLAGQIQNIVLYLESRTEIPAEATEALRVER